MTLGGGGQCCTGAGMVTGAYTYGTGKGIPEDSPGSLGEKWALLVLMESAVYFV